MTAVADSEILNFYNQRSILITGATGFLGKILVEKLLRSVRGVRNIFLLIRPQNGLDANQRLEIFLRSQVTIKKLLLYLYFGTLFYIVTLMGNQKDLYVGMLC